MSSVSSSPSPRSPTVINPSLQATNFSIGDSIDEKHENHCRVTLQNPNGLSYEHDCFEYLLCLQHMSDVSTDIFLLSETNLDWRSYQVYKSLSQHRRSLFQHSKQVTASSSIRFSTPYQPGGVATILKDHTVGRFHSSLSDDLGRWTIVNLSIRNSTVLSIVTCYQVCAQRPQNAGPKTAFMQQWTSLRNNDTTSPNPRKQFIKDLDRQLEILQEQGNFILLCGDFNESMGDNHLGLDMLLNKYSLRDAVDYLHGESEVPTYSRGTRRLDYMFANPGLLPAIKRSGIPSFDHVYTSDHRAVFVDLDLSLLGATEVSLVPPSMRSLHSNNTKHKSIYLDHLHSLLNEHRVFQRAQQLNVCSPNHRLVEQIDRDITRSMIASEKRLKRTSPSPFSSKLAQACLKVTILKLQLKSLRQRRSRAASIELLQSKLKSSLSLTSNVPAMKTLLKQSRKEVRQCRKQASSLRLEFLDHLESDPTKSKIIKRIRQAEEVRRMYLKIRFILQPSSESVITHIQIPADNLPPKQAREWTTITDPEDVTTALFTRNVNHFSAAHGSPFTVSPLLDDYDWSSTSENAHMTLAGLPPTYPNDLVNRLLSHLRRKVPPCLAPLTVSQFIRRLRRWRETTTTSPSRRHLGHYRVLLPPSTFDLPDYLNSPAGKILQLHLRILNYCALTGYSLHRWRKIVTTVIPKELNNFKIHRFRVIHLYEADLTALFSTWSKRMVHASEKHKAINPGSFGARPGRSSSDPAFITLLQTELAHISRTSLLCCPNDASQCYDRIVPNHATLSCISHGMSPSAAKCIGQTLQHARYHLKTSLSETSTYWKHSSHTPIYGTGQGSGISPGVCCMTYSDLFDVHSELNFPSHYTCPNSTSSTTVHNIGFVDDTTTTTNDFCQSAALPLPVLLSQLQHSVQKWNDLLYVSGGALELSKTELYALTWSFSPLGFPLPDNNTSKSITLSSSSSTFSVQVSPSSHSFKILGFYLSMTQNMDAQFEAALKKCHQRAHAISGSSTDHRESWLAYFSVWFPSLVYILPLTTFDAKQCFRLQSKPTSLFLQKCGYASTTKRLLVFASRASGGLGMRDIYLEQGIAQLQRLFQALRTPGYPRDLLLLSLKWWHVHAGVNFNLLQEPSRPCHHLEGSWLSSIRQFLSTCQGSLAFHDRFHSLPLRESDECIMTVLTESTKFGSKRMRVLNHCRLYLRVTYISELSTSLGDCLIPHFWCGSYDDRQSHPLHLFPRQSKPNDYAWALWRRAIRQAFCYPRSSRLRRPLGAWTTTAHRRYFSISRSPPYLWNTRSRPCCHLPHPLRSNHYFRSSRPATPPIHTLPVDILSMSRLIAVSTPHSVPCPTPPPPVPSTLLERLSNLPPWQHRLLSHVTHHVPPCEVLHLLSVNTISSASTIAASDGGADANNGSFGWSIRCDARDLVSCHGPADGSVPGSYRAECTGALSLLLYLYLLGQHRSSSSHFLRVYIDNRALLHRLHNLQDRYYYSPSEGLHSERDLLIEAEWILDSTSISFEFHHISSHQDDHNSLSSLSFPAQANVRADSLATQGLRSCPSLPLPLPTPRSVCQLSVFGQSITRHLPQRLRFLYYDQRVRTYISSRHNWPSEHLVDWHVFHSQCSRNSRILGFYFKLIHYLLPTGSVVHRYDPSHSPFCPACGDNETNDHLILCSHSTRIPYHIKLLSDLRRVLASISSDPILKDILVAGVNSYLTSQSFSFSSFPARYLGLCVAQDLLGWDSFLRGFCSVHWRVLQDEYYRVHFPKLVGQPGLLRALDSVWRSLRSLWFYRNQQRHNKDVALRETELERRTNQSLRDLYRIRLSVLPCDRCVYRSTLDVHLRESLANRVAWVSSHQTRLHSSLELATRDNVTHTLPLSHYFSPEFSPP